jgi:hypothetical protein
MKTDYNPAMARKQKQPARRRTKPSDTPAENGSRAQDCRAKAAYCKWVASISTNEVWQQHYAKLSVEWEEEAAKRNKSSQPAQP